MAEKEEVKWYQAAIWYWPQDGLKSERIAIGPPRRLIADILLDIVREERGPIAQRIGRNPQDIWEYGAGVLWPDTYPKWIGHDALKLLENA